MKKLVERSSTDPTFVITTYEGQHTHQIPVVPRGGYLMHVPPPMVDDYGVPRVHLNDMHLPFLNSYLPPPQPLDFRQVAQAERRSDRHRWCFDPRTGAATGSNSISDSKDNIYHQI